MYLIGHCVLTFNFFYLFLLPCRYIFILSKKALMSDALKFNCIQMLSNSVTDNQVKVIPVLNDVEVDCVPSFVRWVTLLTTTDKNYCEQLYNTVSGIIYVIMLPIKHAFY